MLSPRHRAMCLRGALGRDLSCPTLSLPTCPPFGYHLFLVLFFFLSQALKLDKNWQPLSAGARLFCSRLPNECVIWNHRGGARLVVRSTGKPAFSGGGGTPPGLRRLLAGSLRPAVPPPRRAKCILSSLNTLPDFQGVPGPGPGFGDTVVIKTKPCPQGTCLLLSITGTVCLKDTPPNR